MVGAWLALMGSWPVVWCGAVIFVVREWKLAVWVWVAGPVKL